jgi:multimeric flavodoxin WrbA
LTPVLEKIESCDGLVLGSPIYINEVTASVRAFIERLTFQYVTYDKARPTFFQGRIPTVFIYTMNVSEDQADTFGYTARFKEYETRFERIMRGPVKTLICTETWQTKDYGKYEMSMFDGEARKKRREEVFPLDLKKAFELGLALGKI